VPHLHAADGSSRRTARHHQEFLVGEAEMSSW
jgi:hypothetical protein